MKKFILRPLLITVFVSGIVFVGNLYSQTAGTFKYSLTTNATEGYSPEHLIAIWIEDSTGAFVKTILKQSSAEHLDHLSRWTEKSVSKEIDATSGATLALHGKLSVNWAGTDVSGKLSADGAYSVWLEMAWDDSYKTGKKITSFSFTKGKNAFHSTPDDTPNFTGITLDWLPACASNK